MGAMKSYKERIMDKYLALAVDVSLQKMVNQDFQLENYKWPDKIKPLN
jgi:hypothetical protein